MTSLLAYGAYVPRARLPIASIGDALGTGAPKGSRSVASYDEDVSSMAVEAARIALLSTDCRPERLFFASSAPPYQDKTNAAVIHAALGLDRSAFAVDMCGAPRSGIAAFLIASEAEAASLAVLSDIRTGLPGSGDERDGGDAAAAFLFGPPTTGSPELARVIGAASTTDEFLERWRVPGSLASKTWEERFAEHVYGPLAEEAFAAALKSAHLSPADVDHLVVTGLASRAVRQFAKQSGVRGEAIAPSLTDRVGNSGAAQPGLLLANVLDRAQPGETVALTHLGDGATVIILRIADSLPLQRSARTVADQLAQPGPSVPYAAFLTWRGFLDREPPRRPEPEAPAGPASHRSSGYKHSFRGTICGACETVNVPPSRVCFKCGSSDNMTERSMSEVRGTVVTFTVDRLAFTPSPPMIAVVIDFDGGGRFRCELADARPEDVQIGTRVELTFRRLLTANGVHNYFWKARPVLGGEDS